MAILIKNTRDISLQGLKALVYGPAGIGKTTLCASADDTIVISAEKGLLSIKEAEVDYIEITSLADLGEAYHYVIQSQYKTICFDSISDVAEVVLSELLKDYKDPRQAYGDMADKITAIVRLFRDIDGFNVVFTSKERRLVNESGVVSYVPSCPGKQLPEALPYLFDLVMPMQIGKLEDGTKYRYLQTETGRRYIAKDRSGKLNPIEEPHLQKLFDKISGINSTEKEK